MTDKSIRSNAGAHSASAFDIPAGDPIYSLTLWPHRSLSRRGFRALLLFASLAFALPLLAFVGTSAVWFLAPYLAFHVWLLWFLIHRSYVDGRVSETLQLWPSLITVDRSEPNGHRQSWQANPYWVQLEMHAGHRLENYLTLKGNGREIELGAFLSPDERQEIHTDLLDALQRARAH